MHVKWLLCRKLPRSGLPKWQNGCNVHIQNVHNVKLGRCKLISIKQFLCHLQSALSHIFSLTRLLVLDWEMYQSIKTLAFLKDLSWSHCTEQMCNLTLKKLGYLQRALPSAPINTRLLTYNTLVRPMLEYGLIVRKSFKKSDIDKIESIQEKAVCFIYCHDRYFSPSSHLWIFSLPLSLPVVMLTLQSFFMLRLTLHDFLY